MSGSKLALATLASAAYSATGVGLADMIEDAARKARNGNSKYAPHQGSKEMQRRLKRMQRAKDTGEK